ncbi:MAG: hypothetical protein ABR592_05990 [Nitriliruptorales bacterium]
MTAPEVDSRTDGWVEAAHPDQGFTLRHPPDWRAHQGRGSRPLVLVGPGVASRPVAEAAAPPTPAAADLNGYVDVQLASLGRLLTDLRLISDDPARLGELEGRRLLCSYRQGIYLINIVVWTALAAEQALSLSGICVATDYDRLEPTFEGIAASTRLTLDLPGGTS